MAQLYKPELGWSDGLSALIFHGQRADDATVFNLTSVFQIAELYTESHCAEAKLVLGYIIGGYTRHIASYSEGHYLLTAKGGRKQSSLLQARGLTPRDAWVLDPADPRQV